MTVGKGSRRCFDRGVDLGRKLSTQTIRNALALVRRALADAADEGLVASNVAAGVTVPRRATSEEPWAYLSADEIGDVLALELRPEQRAIFTVAIFAGLRGGELWGFYGGATCALTGDRPELVVRHSYRGPTKGGRVRRVPLLRQAREALEAWRRVAPGVGHALVFPAEVGAPTVSPDATPRGSTSGWPRVLRTRCRRHEARAVSPTCDTRAARTS